MCLRGRVTLRARSARDEELGSHALTRRAHLLVLAQGRVGSSMMRAHIHGAAASDNVIARYGPDDRRYD
jgi:hypothetical protein